MSKFLYILLLPIFMFGQDGLPPNPPVYEKWMVSFDSVQYLVDYHGFIRKQAPSTSKKIMTVAEAKAHLWLDETYIPLSERPAYQTVARYTLKERDMSPVLSVSSIGQTSVTLTWTDPVAGASTGHVEYAVQCCGEENIWRWDSQSPTPPRTISGLLPNTTYRFRYRASNPIYPSPGYGPYSNVVETTTGNITANTPPTAPALSVTSVGNTVASIAWTASTDNTGVAGYRVTRWISIYGLWSVMTTTYVSSATLTYNATGLLNGSTYRYMVEAYDAEGQYTASNYVTLTPTTSTVNPAYIMNNITYHEYNGTYNDGSITLRFQYPTLVGYTPNYYQLEYKLNSSATWLVYGTTYPYTPSGNAYNVAGLIPFEKYDFRIRFITTTGLWSNYSNTYTAQLSAFSDVKTDWVSFETSVISFSSVAPINVSGFNHYPTKYIVEYDTYYDTDGDTPPDGLVNPPEFNYTNTSTKEVSISNPPSEINIQLHRPNGGTDDCSNPRWLWYKYRLKAIYKKADNVEPPYEGEWTDWYYVALQPYNAVHTLALPNNYSICLYCGLAYPAYIAIDASSWWAQPVSTYVFEGVSQASPIKNYSITVSNTYDITANFVAGGSETKQLGVTTLNCTSGTTLGFPPTWILKY